IAQDEPTQCSGLAKGMTSGAAGSHASATHFRLEAVSHHTTALAQSVAGTPQIISADTVEHGIDAVTGKPMNLLHEVRVLVIDGDAAQFPDYWCSLCRTRSVHLNASQFSQLQHRRADAARGPVDQHS